MSGLLNRNKIIILVAVFIILVSTIHFTSFPRPNLSFAEKLFRDLIAPLQTGVTRINRYVDNLLEKIQAYQQLLAEKEELEQLVIELEQQLNQMAEYKRENEILRHALIFKQETDYQLVMSEVIARSSANWLSTITINRGSKHGIEPGMPVMSGRGIVGTVYQVSARTATVILATDPQSAVGGLVQSTGDLVLVEGDPEYSGLLLARTLAKDVELKVGDILVTSGLSRLYPKGMPIGQVTAVHPGRYEHSATAYVEPFVDFAKLEFVFVVIDER